MPGGNRPRVAILDDYAGVALKLADWSVVQAVADIVVFRDHLSLDQAIAQLADFDILCSIRQRMAFPERLLAALPRLRLLTVIGDDLPGLDRDAAARLGIEIRNARGSTADRIVTENATPELAWALLLALARQIPRQDQSLRPDGWQTHAGTILYGKTLGLLGLGKLGRRVAAYGRAFGMRVIAWSQNLTEPVADAEQVERVEREALFDQADALSIHLRLSERTRGLVDAAALARMKPTAFLINTSRGPIIDQQALLATLGAGRIAGAGLDVFDEEPLAAGHPLRALTNVILTPHLGYFTTETMTAFYRGTAQTVAAALGCLPDALRA